MRRTTLPLWCSPQHRSHGGTAAPSERQRRQRPSHRRQPPTPGPAIAVWYHPAKPRRCHRRCHPTTAAVATTTPPQRPQPPPSHHRRRRRRHPTTAAAAHHRRALPSPTRLDPPPRAHRWAPPPLRRGPPLRRRPAAPPRSQRPPSPAGDHRPTGRRRVPTAGRHRCLTGGSRCPTAAAAPTPCARPARRPRGSATPAGGTPPATCGRLTTSPPPRSLLNSPLRTGGENPSGGRRTRGQQSQRQPWPRRRRPR